MRRPCGSRASHQLHVPPRYPPMRKPGDTSRYRWKARPTLLRRLHVTGGSPARRAVRGASPATPTSPAAGSSSRETAYARIAATASLPARHGDAGCAVLRQDAQERGCFGAEASDFDPDYDEPRTCGTVEFGVGLAPFASAASCTAAAGRVSAPGRAEPDRVTGLTIVASIAKRGTMPHGHRARGRVEGEKGASRRRAHRRRKRQRVASHARFLPQPEFVVEPVSGSPPEERG